MRGRPRKVFTPEMKVGDTVTIAGLESPMVIVDDDTPLTVTVSPSADAPPKFDVTGCKCGLVSIYMVEGKCRRCGAVIVQ